MTIVMRTTIECDRCTRTAGYQNGSVFLMADAENDDTPPGGDLRHLCSKCRAAFLRFMDGHAIEPLDMRNTRTPGSGDPGGGVP